MSYNPITDFLALLRQTPGGERMASMPGLDFVVSAMARAGLFTLYVGQTAPTSNQSTTVWLQPSNPSWVAEGAVFLWNGTAYAPATPALWSALLTPGAANVKILTAAGPYAALPTDGVLVVKQAVSAPFIVTVNWAQRFAPLRIVDGKGDAAVNNITITPAAGQTQLASLNYSYVIDGNGGSIILTPLPDGSGAY